MVELVYKFNEKSTMSVSKGESTAKMQFNIFGSHTYIHIYAIGHHFDHVRTVHASVSGVKIKVFSLVIYNE